MRWVCSEDYVDDADMLPMPWDQRIACTCLGAVFICLALYAAGGWRWGHYMAIPLALTCILLIWRACNHAMRGTLSRQFREYLPPDHGPVNELRVIDQPKSGALGVERPDLDARPPNRESPRKIVFFSYAREDRPLLEHLALELENRGIGVRDDRTLTPGPSHWPQLQKLIRAGDAFLFLISPNSVLTNNVDTEIKFAGQLKKKILPVVIKDGYDEKLLPKDVRDPQWVFLRADDDFDREVTKLVASIDLDFHLWHTQAWLTESAKEWQERGQDRAALLRGLILRFGGLA